MNNTKRNEKINELESIERQLDAKEAVTNIKISSEVKIKK